MENITIRIGYNIDGDLGNCKIEDIFAEWIGSHGSVIGSESVNGTKDFAIEIETVEVEL